MVKYMYWGEGFTKQQLFGTLKCFSYFKKQIYLFACIYLPILSKSFPYTFFSFLNERELLYFGQIFIQSKVGSGEKCIVIGEIYCVLP